MTNQPNKTGTRVLYPFLFSIVLAGGVLLGFLISRQSQDKPLLPSGVQTTELEEILGYINERYVDEVNTDSLRELAISEMFLHLDPHSFYIPASKLRKSYEDLDAQLDGVGIEFNIIQDTILVVAALAGGPAEQAGMLSGDRIIKINDTLVAGTGITNDMVIGKLRGERGTEVKVTALRGSSGKTYDFTLSRDRIQLNSVVAAHMMDARSGYVRMSQFTQTTHREFVDAVRKLKKQGMTRLLLDLRDNGGGYLDAAVNIADEFIDGQKLIVYTQGQRSPRQNSPAGHPGVFEQGDVVVLINEGSASASEILAGALQDWNRAIIVGRRSFGKGLVQGQIKLHDGGAIRLTTARYYTPKGRSIQRPYDEGVKAYYAELGERLVSEYIHPDSSYQSDSIEWGITPDVFIAVDTSEVNTTIEALVATGVVHEFCYSYFESHRNELSYKTLGEFSSKFSVSESLFTQFRTFAARRQNEVSDSKISGARPLLSAVIGAILAKQLFYTDGYYRMLNKGDKEVQAAYATLDQAGRLTSSGIQSAPGLR